MRLILCGAALATAAGLGCGGGGSNDKVPLELGVGVSAATEGGKDSWFGFTPADATPLLVSVSPESTPLVLEIIDEASGDILATGTAQGTLRLASWTPEPGAPVCVRLDNTGDSPYAGVLTLEVAPTATIVNVSTPGGGDGMLVRLTNDFGVMVVNCLQRLDMNPGTGTWTFVFGAGDAATGPFTVGFTLININDPGMMMPSQTIAFGSADLPVMEGVVNNTLAIPLTATAGMPPPAPDCAAAGMLSALVPAGTYGTSDLR